MKLMLKWPGLHYSTSAFAPKHYPKAIIDYANTRGADKIIYAGYFPMGLSLERIMTEMPQRAVQGRGCGRSSSARTPCGCWGSTTEGLTMAEAAERRGAHKQLSAACRHAWTCANVAVTCTYRAGQPRGTHGATTNHDSRR